MMDKSITTQRDLRGYAGNPPDPKWPGGARLALQIVLNAGVAQGSVWIESGHGATAPLAASAKAEVSRA